ncbi:MAG: DUF2807 domain-containing protein [Muribaculaceae bacterium]|nr:DUF2807 domain-containing protein [Muribaculaceae bacterium]
MRTFSALAVSASLFLLSSCSISNAGESLSQISNMFGETVKPSANTITETIPAQNVSGVSTSAGIKVIYSQGPQTSVKLTVPENIRKYIKVECQNGILSCTRESNVNFGRRLPDIIVTVQSPGITMVTASSGSSFTMSDKLSMPRKDITISVSSGAAISLFNVEAKDVTLTASSGAALSIIGLVTQDISASSSSGAGIHLSDITATEVNATASSGAGISLTGTTEELNMVASSGASIAASSLKASNVSKSTSSGGSAIN